MKYCSHCGEAVEHKIPEDDDRLRHVCPGCGTIHYHNPKVVVGCLPVRGEQVLLCKRAIEPRRGYWTIPAGFMENQETMVEGALRETWEEARAKVVNEQLYRLFDLPRINQVYVFYRAELDGDFGVGPESLDTALFNEDEIPWSELSFPVITDLLQEFFSDRREQHFPVRVSEPGPLWAEHTGFKLR